MQLVSQVMASTRRCATGRDAACRRRRLRGCRPYAPICHDQWHYTRADPNMSGNFQQPQQRRQSGASEMHAGTVTAATHRDLCCHWKVWRLRVA